MSKNAPNRALCILPFTHMQIGNNGNVRLCCQTPYVEDELGTPLNVYQHSVDEIWNSAFMRTVRRSMIVGERVEHCTMCWQQEDAGGVSRRMSENALWRRGLMRRELARFAGWRFLESLFDPFRRIKTDAIARDYSLLSYPIDLELEVGNTCNLKCRMCSPQFSSKIQHDDVHSKWHEKEGQASAGGEAAKPSYYPASRLPEKKHWFKEQALIYGELLRAPKAIRHISYKGGEPLVSQEALDIVSYLGKEGRSKSLRFSITTNGTVCNLEFLRDCSRFQVVELAVSLDSIEAQYEYIRFPAKWDVVVDNIRRFSAQRNVYLMASVTFQAYNALQIVGLFRFCDSLGLEISISTLWTPSHLAVSVLPPNARRVAAQRIRDYARKDCKKKNRSRIYALATGLDAIQDEWDTEGLRTFMLFTNDLDRSRGQDFAATNPELLRFIEEAGMQWSAESKHFVDMT